MAWLNAPVAEGEVAGGTVVYFGPRVGLPLPIAHDAGGAEVVAVDVEQAVFSFLVAADAGGDGFAGQRIRFAGDGVCGAQPLLFRITECQPTFVQRNLVAELHVGGSGRRREGLADCCAAAIKVNRVLPKYLRIGAAAGIVGHDLAPGLLQITCQVQVKRVFMTACCGYGIAPTGEDQVAQSKASSGGCLQATRPKQTRSRQINLDRLERRQRFVASDRYVNMMRPAPDSGLVLYDKANPLRWRYSSAGKGYCP
jgi:hypothetical protein